MPLILPNLDDRSYADLVADARALIPALAPDWTDHNPADPGITLIELFAWLTEMLLYRLNQVTDANRLAFLNLINGPDWQNERRDPVSAAFRSLIVGLPDDQKSVAEKARDDILLAFDHLIAGPYVDENSVAAGIRDTVLPAFARLISGLRGDQKSVAAEFRDRVLVAFRSLTTKSVAEEVRETVLALRQPARAVTTDDFERLALAAHPWVARAYCVPRRNLDQGSREERARDLPAAVSVVILPKPDAREEPPLLSAVRAALEPARLLTTRLHVVARRRVPIVVTLTVQGQHAHAARPFVAPPSGAVAVTLTIYSRRDVRERDLLERAEEALRTFLDPYVGGSEGRGWPFGRFVYLSEIYDLLARLPGADYVTSTKGKAFVPDPSSEWRMRDQATSELASFALDPDELPAPQLPAGEIIVTVSQDVASAPGEA